MDDATFKKLFSHRRMIELLIRRQIPEWDGKIEYSTLERLPTELIDERLRRRYADMIWRARTTDGTTDLVLLLELQGRPERHMVLRTTTYNILAVQELIEHDKELRRGERHLAVESLVLHHGDRQWNAPTRLRDLFLDSAPDTYRLVERLPSDAPPQGPLDLHGPGHEGDVTFEGIRERATEGGVDDGSGGDGVSAQSGRHQAGGNGGGNGGGTGDGPAPTGCPQVR